MPEPWKIEREQKIWLPKSMESEAGRDEFLRKELSNFCGKYKIGTMICMYVNYAEPTKGRIMLIGQPSAKWLDAAWQRLRLFASDLISKGSVK